MTRFAALLLVSLLVPAASAQTKDPDAPVPAREASLRMTVPEGFKVALFAGEPDVVQPIGFTFDDRGRLWVAECRSYPKWIKPDQGATLAPGVPVGNDRVLIFEDTDGDGQFDKRTVFADKLANLSGINYGFGGIWLCAIPNLLFIPDKDGDDRPDGPPEIKLDGWSLQSGHNAFNGIKWGPDGWLYGCNGILATSRVGPPGTPDKDRVPINCGVWRYHPTKKKFEVVAHGTTNPWGLDWDEYGELFITNCVIDHVWHIVPGGHYERMYGSDFNPHLYKLMPSIADHIHWGGGNWTSSRGGKGVHSEAGGGHAHVGCMIYLGDNWPKQYRGGLFTCNLHGNRINHDLLERKGSSYAARHGNDFLFANDPWFRGLGIDYGPDGGVYVSDWTDTGECHNYQVAHTSTGRIYKVMYGQPRAWRGDLSKLSTSELYLSLIEGNAWVSRHAQRLLQERAAAKIITAKDEELLLGLANGHLDDRQMLRGLWTRHALGKPPVWGFLLGTESRHESLRAWTVRFALDDAPGALHRPPLAGWTIDKLLAHAASDSSRLVRLHIAAGLTRLPLEMRWNIVEKLLKHNADAEDAYIPSLIWYAMEPVIAARPAGRWLGSLRFPTLREFAAKRLTSLPGGVEAIVSELDSDDDDAQFLQRDALRGTLAGLQGRRNVPMPPGWEDAYPVLVESPLPEVRDKAMLLAVLFGDKRALNGLRDIAVNRRAPLSQRRQALQTLSLKQPPQLVRLLQQLLDDPELRSPAIQGLAALPDEHTPRLLLERYDKLTVDERTDAILTLAARPEYALDLLDAVEQKIVPRQDVSAFMVRQLLALNNKRVTERVNQVWGTLRSPSADKAARLTNLKKQLEPATLKQANLAQGRALYTKHCASCHKLFGEGGAIGPDLTGSQRTNLDYLLENMLDPSAVVPREYQVHVVLTASGRTISGILKEETDKALVMQTQNETIVVPKDEIDSRRQSGVSMMPEGVIEQLRPDELRDLVAYLAGASR